MVQYQDPTQPYAAKREGLITQFETLLSVPHSVTVNNWTFGFIETLNPIRDSDGKPTLFNPQDRFLNPRCLTLNPHGKGPFCSFRVSQPIGLSGVYLLVVTNQIHYVGECLDLLKRFNQGYGYISPRNCFTGGQSTNCKINKKVLEVALAGGGIDLYFFATKERKQVERDLLSIKRPDWNSR